MSDLATVFNMVRNLNIGSILRKSTYEQYDDLSGLTINLKDPNQLLLWYELQGMVEKLASVKSRADYLSKEVKSMGKLRKNSRDRYELDGKEFTCGDRIEALVDDGFYRVPYWTVTSVEHDGQDYYLVGNKNVKLQGLKVRIRA